MQQHIDFPMEISVLKFQACQFDEKPDRCLGTQSSSEARLRKFWDNLLFSLLTINRNTCCEYSNEPALLSIQNML